MKFDFKNNLKGNLSFNLADFGNSAGKIWGKIHFWVFFAFLILSMLIGLGIWKGDIIGTSSWNDQKKQDYLNAQNTGSTFKEKEFNDVVDNIRARNQENNSPYEPIKDIFKAY